MRKRKKSRKRRKQNWEIASWLNRRPFLLFLLLFPWPQRPQSGQGQKARKKNPWVFFLWGWRRSIPIIIKRFDGRRLSETLQFRTLKKKFYWRRRRKENLRLQQQRKKCLSAIFVITEREEKKKLMCEWCGGRLLPLDLLEVVHGLQTEGENVSGASRLPPPPPLLLWRRASGSPQPHPGRLHGSVRWGRCREMLQY